MEYLDEVYPDRPLLLPKDPLQRVRARQIAEIVNSGIQPLQNIGDNYLAHKISICT